LRALVETIVRNFPRGKAVELGIGFQTKVALRLIQLGYDVLAIDWNERAVENARKRGIKALRDDIFRPRLGLYRDAVVLYSIRPAPEMLPALFKLSQRTGVPLLVRPMGSDSLHGMRPVAQGVYLYRGDV